ncbi:hypothetical protein JTE90_024679 [Oedothorax gibbosus]|uniref:Uncharacterized protein n=1 Tax=Oedothorax gibbosus TaxID=931172 RepID=A0AAV6TJE0_9ARAC|nr:hypothetical protein JTE90_024679 [Oedothorax gibbosus]
MTKMWHTPPGDVPQMPPFEDPVPNLLWNTMSSAAEWNEAFPQPVPFWRGNTPLCRSIFRWRTEWGIFGQNRSTKRYVNTYYTTNTTINNNLDMTNNGAHRIGANFPPSPPLRSCSEPVMEQMYMEQGFFLRLCLHGGKKAPCRVCSVKDSSGGMFGGGEVMVGKL